METCMWCSEKVDGRYFTTTQTFYKNFTVGKCEIKYFCSGVCGADYGAAMAKWMLKLVEDRRQIMGWFKEKD